MDGEEECKWKINRWKKEERESVRVQIKVKNGDILGREESCKLRSEVGNRNHKTCL